MNRVSKQPAIILHPPGPTNQGRPRQSRNVRRAIWCFIAICTFGTQVASAQDTERHLFILSGQSNMVRMKPEAGFNTDDVNGPKDGLHYPPEGYVLMGKRMARQAAALIQGNKPDPAE